MLRILLWCLKQSGGERDSLVLLEKQKEYPRLQQAPRLALSLYTQSYGDFSTAVWGETHSRDIPQSPPAPLAADQLTGICRLPDTFFLPQNYWLYLSIFLPLIWARSPTSMHFQTGFVTCKDYRAGLESQRQGVQISGLTSLPRLYPENASEEETSKYKLNKSYITFLIPMDSSENTQLCTV